MELSFTSLPSSRGGVAAHQENGAERPLKAQTGWSKSFLTTPPLLTMEAFGDIRFRSRPPLLWRRGIATVLRFYICTAWKKG